MGLKKQNTVEASLSPISLKGSSAMLALVISACTVFPIERDSPYFTERYATPVFFVGYNYISERFIEKVDIGYLTVAGLEGLTAIDPQLEITRDGDFVSLAVDNNFLHTVSAPAAANTKAWADLTVKIIENGRLASTPLLETQAEDIYSSIFQSMMTELDGFSRYAGAFEAHRDRYRRSGFGGIGVQILIDGNKVHVVSVLPDTPAKEMGLQDNDRITHIDDESVAGLTIHEVVERLRGEIGSHVTIIVERDSRDHFLSVTLSRRLIMDVTVTYKMIDDLGHIKITSFNKRTSKSLENTLAKIQPAIESRKIKGIILDLRSNPGGLLDQAVKVADLFLTKGQIVSTKGRHPDSNQNFSADKESFAQNLPLAVLINGNTASAAEIVAAALQDQGRAVVIGTNSYGKGTVQNVIALPNNGELTLTWSRFHAPSGYTLNNLGVLPTICTSRETTGSTEKENANFTPRPKELHTGAIVSETALSKWRAEDLPSEKNIEELRAICPDPKKASDRDITVAKQLLTEPALYSRAMSLSFPAIANR